MAPSSAAKGTATSAQDQEVFDLRQTGKSFAGIASALSLGTTRDAHSAFLRVLSRAGTKLDALRKEEMGRLTALEKKIKANKELAPFDRSKKLDVISHLRRQLNELG